MSTRRKRSRRNSQLFMNAIVAVLCIVIVLIFLIVLLTQTGKTKTKQLPTAADAAVSEEVTTQAPTEAPTEPESLLTYPMVSSAVYPLTAQNVTSEYAILLDVNNNEILAERNADTRFYPASMTKIMTLLVAAEQIEDMNDTFTMTYDIIAPLIEADASRAGFEEGEEVTITDLLYGIALPSGADATTAIAIYLCGSEEAFVTLMNDKVEELGLKNTHFCNASGLHDENHYTTATDMALLMSYVMENPICKEILGTYQYTTSQTEQHPEGILLTSTMYSRMYGDEVEGMTITGGKTGYTDEAGHCLVSYAEDEKGNSYVTVVAKDTTYWRAIFDTFAIYGLVNNGYPMPTDLIAEEATEESDDEYAVAGNSGE